MKVGEFWEKLIQLLNKKMFLWQTGSRNDIFVAVDAVVAIDTVDTVDAVVV